MLSNAYFVAKFRFDTAENEPAKNLQNFVIFFAKFANFANPDLGRAPAAPDAGGRLLALPRGPGRRAGARLRERRRVVAKFWQISLVFGCIGTDFCKKVCVLQHFSKSTRLSS